jgi:hypothetical protein
MDYYYKEGKESKAEKKKGSKKTGSSNSNKEMNNEPYPGLPIYGLRLRIPLPAPDSRIHDKTLYTKKDGFRFKRRI